MRPQFCYNAISIYLLLQELFWSGHEYLLSCTILLTFYFICWMLSLLQPSLPQKFKHLTQSFDMTKISEICKNFVLSVFMKKLSLIQFQSSLGVDLLPLLNDDFSCPDFRVVHDLLYYPLGVRINRSRTSDILWDFKSMISYSRAASILCIWSAN